QVFDRIQIGRIRRQVGDLDLSVQAVEVLAYEAAAMCSQSVPDDQQRLLQVRLQGLEKVDDLLLLDTSLVQPEQAVGAGEPGDHRDVVPADVELDVGSVACHATSTYPCTPIAAPRLIDYQIPA